MRHSVDYAYLGNGIGATKTHRGHRIFVYTKDLGLSPHIIMEGIWEWAIEHAILKLFEPGAVVIEVGCNMGYHTLAMCDRLGADGRLYGFEANPTIFNLLRWSVDHNGFFPRATLYNHAATQVRGEVQFTYDETAIGGGHVSTDGANDGTLITVPGLPLDEVLPDLRNVALLRMDVEGFEPFVIRGAKNILERSPDVTIVVEWSVSMMVSRGSELVGFIDEMAEKGFSAWRIDGNSQFSPVPMRDLMHLPHCEVAFARTDLGRFNERDDEKN